MSIVLPATHPFTLLRTAGGLYLVTRRRWGKVTSFRRSLVSPMHQMRRHEFPIQVHMGNDSRLDSDMALRDVGIDDLSPGMLSVYFQGRAVSDWVTTSGVADTYSGELVGSIAAGFAHVMFNSVEAWLIDVDGITATRLLQRGWHGPTETRELRELRQEMPHARLLQVRHTQILPDYYPVIEEAAWAWIPQIELFWRAVDDHGVTVRGIHYEPRDANLISVLLDDVPTVRGEVSALPWLVDEFTALLEGIRATCQVCGVDGVEVRVPNPYLYEHYILCGPCRAHVLTTQGDQLTPNGGLSAQFFAGDEVTVWRAADALYALSEDGFAKVASLNPRAPLLPSHPEPGKLLALLMCRHRTRLPHPADTFKEPHLTQVPAADTLPGMHLELLHPSPHDPTRFHALDVYRGTVDTHLSDNGSYLVYTAHPEGGKNATWLIDHGTTVKLLQHGWDSHPTTPPALSDLLSGSEGEVGIIKLHTIRTGTSSHRIAFDGYAPGWASHLDTFDTALHQLDQELQITHAALDPLTGLPQLRVTGLSPDSFHAINSIAHRHMKTFITRCVTTCMMCGSVGASQTACVDERTGGRVHRYVCREHWS